MPDKIQRYNRLYNKAKSILISKNDTLDIIGKMATLSALLKIEFREWVFCGFYRAVGPRTLEIGPYQGEILACGKIDFSRGVCGAAAMERKTIIVDDVRTYSGYIACDDQTRSEIVVPVFKDNTLIAVLDIDSAKIGAFDSTDKIQLEKLAGLIT